MKKILFLLTMLLCSFTLTADFEDEPIEIQSGYCEGRGKILDREEDMLFVGITTTYSLCRINGLRYKNIKVIREARIFGHPERFKLQSKENYDGKLLCMQVDYDNRILRIFPPVDQLCEGIERERR
jgi:hypothetical protein